MVDVVRYQEKDYKRCCGNCQFYNHGCTNSKKREYCIKKKLWIKKFIPSDIACKYWKFKPNMEYDGKAEKNIIDLIINVGTKKNQQYASFKKVSCTHLNKRGESLLFVAEDCSVQCKNCGQKYIFNEEELYNV